MKIKQIYQNIKYKITRNKKVIIIISLVFTLLFSIYNRVLGAINKSLWHESISVYYFLLVSIKSFLLLYIYNSKERKNDVKVFKITKWLLLILNILLCIPISLLVLDKRTVEMSLVFSIAIALYVTIKTIKSIHNYVKHKKVDDILLKELRVIDLTDVVVAILTLQNTLINVNQKGFQIELYYLTIISSFIGVLINFFFLFTLRIKKDHNA